MDYREYVTALLGQHPALGAEMGRCNNLENVLQWLKDRGLSLGSLDLVTQDEYSFDLLIPLGPGEQHLVVGIT